MRSLIHSLLLLPISILNIQGQDESPTVDSIDIEQIVISASRANIGDPITFQNITSAKIEKIYNGQDPAVLLQQLSPSIVSYSDAGTDIGNYAQFRMRGISQSRINVTLNGVPLNDMVDQGVFFSNFSDFSSSVESIQIQRGVSASSTGVASYGGAINFQSINVFSGEPSTKLQLTTGSFGTLRTSAEIKTGLKNNIGAYGRMTRTSVDGFKTHSASDSYSIFGSVGYAGEKEIIKLTSFLGKTQNDQSYLPVLLSDILTDPKTNYNHPNDTDDFEQELIQLQYTRTLNDKTHLDATLYYGGARGEFPFGIDDETQFVFGLSNDHYGMLSHVTYEDPKISIKGGLQIYKFDRTNYEYIAPNVSNPYDRDHTTKNEIGIFSRINYKLEHLSIYGDLQLRSVGVDLTPDKDLGTGLNLDLNWLFLNLVGGLNYQLNDHQSLYISYGRSGREPTRSDIRNGVVKEEYVNDIEFGWKLKNNKWNIAANLFHMTFDNEISSVGALTARSYMEIRQNVPESRRSGIELELEYSASDKLNISFNSAYMDTNVSEYNNGINLLKDVSQIFSPKWVIRPQISYKISERFGLSLSGRHVSESFMELANIDSFTLPAHSVLNTQVDFSISDKASMSLMLNNILDELYFTDGAPVDFDFDGIIEGSGHRIQPPRHFYVVFKVNM